MHLNHVKNKLPQRHRKYLVRFIETKVKNVNSPQHVSTYFTIQAAPVNSDVKHDKFLMTFGSACHLWVVIYAVTEVCVGRDMLRHVI